VRGNVGSRVDGVEGETEMHGVASSTETFGSITSEASRSTGPRRFREVTFVKSGGPRQSVSFATDYQL